MTLPRDPETGYIDELEPPCCTACGDDCANGQTLCDMCNRCLRCHHEDTIGSTELCDYCEEEIRAINARDWAADTAYRASIGD